MKFKYQWGEYEGQMQGDVMQGKGRFQYGDNDMYEVCIRHITFYDTTQYDMSYDSYRPFFLSLLQMFSLSLGGLEGWQTTWPRYATMVEW